LAVTLFSDPRTPDAGRSMWLQTSPEFCMKRLLASGAKAIYQITRAFRGGEVGRLHNPEFTMLEWYRVGDSMDAAMDLLSDLCDALLRFGPAERVAFASAFERHVRLDPHRATIPEFRQAAHELGVVVPETISDRNGWINLLLTERVEAHLGATSPTILFDYPASQAALARIRPTDPPVAERFELYVKGIELANGYHELADPEVMLERARAANQRRSEAGKPTLPVESRLVEAMQDGLPDACGVALGFDRLVMIACGASQLSEVIAFPIDRA